MKGEIKYTGCMVHRVVKDVDRGEPIIVKEVAIEEREPLEALEQRLHKVEHEIIVQATKKILEGYVVRYLLLRMVLMMYCRLV